MAAVGKGSDSAKTNTPRDGVKEREALYKDKVDADGNVAVVLKHQNRKRHGHKTSARGGLEARA